MAARRVPYMLSSAEVGCRGSNGGSPVQSTDALPTRPPRRAYVFTLYWACSVLTSYEVRMFKMVLDKYLAIYVDISCKCQAHNTT